MITTKNMFKLYLEIFYKYNQILIWEYIYWEVYILRSKYTESKVYNGFAFKVIEYILNLSPLLTSDIPNDSPHMKIRKTNCQGSKDITPAGKKKKKKKKAVNTKFQKTLKFSGQQNLS